MKNWFPKWLIPVALLLAVATVWLRLSIVRVTYEINQADSLLRNSREELESLELEVARFRSPLYLEKIARKKFGLRPPTAKQIIYLSHAKEKTKR